MPLRVVPTPTRSLVFALLLALLLTLPLAAGQTQQLFGVNITSDSSSGTTTGDCVSFSATIENIGQSPVPQRHDIRLAFGDVPSGWRLDPPANDRLSLASDATQDIQFRICPTDSVDDEESAAVRLTATVQSDPSDPKASDSMRFTATYESDGVFGFDLSPTLFYGGLAVLLGLLGVVLLTRRRPSAGISIACPEPAKEVLPNRGTSFPIRITNEGRERDVVTLTTSPVPQGWDTFLPLVDVPLEPREEQTVWLSVKSPADAGPGDQVVVKVIARSVGSGGAHAEIETLTSVRAPDAPPPAEGAATAPPATPPASEPDQEEEAERSVYERGEGEAPRSKPKPVAVKRQKKR